ncbi:diacylglycerol kinase gamma, partial [Marmota monax]|uniref:diacylglycerol kinase gamma n=1 Tax=Marmota monax TaxID=9995 RepID=UPI001EB0962F
HVWNSAAKSSFLGLQWESSGPFSRSLQPEEFTTSLHSFKKKAFKKPKACGVCKQIIDGQGLSCRACKYSCHKKCEAQVVIPCCVQVHLEQAPGSSTPSSSLCCDKPLRAILKHDWRESWPSAHWDRSHEQEQQSRRRSKQARHKGLVLKSECSREEMKRLKENDVQRLSPCEIPISAAHLPHNGREGPVCSALSFCGAYF